MLLLLAYMYVNEKFTLKEFCEDLAFQLTYDEVYYNFMFDNKITNANSLSIEELLDILIDELDECTYYWLASDEEFINSVTENVLDLLEDDYWTLEEAIKFELYDWYYTPYGWFHIIEW